jgi:guanylate kinase
MMKGLLIVISAPAGCGKDTIIDQLLELRKDICYSVSATTREIRAFEEDGKHYVFKTREEFEELIEKGELLEYAQYCGNYYGTLKKTVEDALGQGRNIVLKIDVQGAQNIMQTFKGNRVSIFILPPSIDELRRRLRSRSTEDEATIERRVKQSMYEIGKSDGYDYLVVNDDLQTAVDKVSEIIDKEMVKRM